MSNRGILGMLLPIQKFQFINKSARFDPVSGRRETWEEALARVEAFMRPRAPAITEAEWAELGTMAREQKALWAMRVLQMAGPSGDRCNVGLYNCAYTAIERLSDFADILYILMQGTGVGFSVEREAVDKLPPVRVPLEDSGSGAYVGTVVEDSTEGWCNALLSGFRMWWEGRDCLFDYSHIRPAGSVLRTKGGRASGPEPLRELLVFSRGIIRGAAGRKLTPLEVHRICCKIGRIVEVGGVRRAAMLSLSDLDDAEMRSAKDGDFWERFPELTMANNSVAYSTKPAFDRFWKEWNALAASGSGERGIFNREHILAREGSRRIFSSASLVGVNPCCEVPLNSKQFCNLTIAVVRSGDTRVDLRKKVRAAAIMGTIQSACTSFQYIGPEWKVTTERERLLGVDLLGALDNENTRDPAFLRELRELVVTTNREYAERLGIPPSTATTCTKPAGNSGVLLNSGNTVTGWFAPFYLRRVRVNKVDPMFGFLCEQGLPWEQEYHDQRIAVFTFPMRAPPGVIMRGDRGALQQLEWWRTLQMNWAEHSVSATIYVRSDEWVDVGWWVWEHWKDITGIAFLPYAEKNYPLAPLEDITEEQYNERVAAFPSIDWVDFCRYEVEQSLGDTTTIRQEPACSAGGCEI